MTMAVRIRAGRKIIVCAAQSAPAPGDCYVGDDLHYVLAVEMHVLRRIGEDKTGASLWVFEGMAQDPSDE